MTSVKFVEGSDSIIEGLGIPFGGPAYLGGKDLHGETFGPDTDLALDWFPNEGRPFLYGHGLDPEIKATVVGRQISRTLTKAGHWVQVQLDKRSRYMADIAALIEAEALSFSSGAMPHLVKTTDEGRIKTWPWIELSGTPTPANPDAAVYAVKSTDAVEHLTAVKAADALRSILASDDGSESEPFGAHAERVSALVDAFAERAKARDEARVKSGRSLSAANREEIREVIESIDRLSERRAHLAGLIDNGSKAAEVEYLRFLREQARANGVLIA